MIIEKNTTIYRNEKKKKYQLYDITRNEAHKRRQVWNQTRTYGSNICVDRVRTDYSLLPSDTWRLRSDSATTPSSV